MPLVRGKPTIRPRISAATRQYPRLDRHDYINNGLLGYWPSNAATTVGSTLVDVTGQSPGTLTASPPLAAGKIRQALSFNGSSQYATVTTPNWGTAVSWSFWIKSPSAPNTGSISQPLLMNGVFGFSWNHSSSSFEQAAFVWDSNGSFWPAAITQTLQPNCWYHITATWSGPSTALSVYLNGVLQSTTTGTAGSLRTNTGATGIGAANGGSAFFNGSMEDVRIWNRALSPAEVMRVANDTSGGLGLVQPRRRVGVASSNITGTLAATTGAATLSSAGTVKVSGTLASTTGAATLSSAGKVLVSGTLSATTGAATLSSAGTVLVSGTLSATAGAATLSAAGSVGTSGALTATTGAATLSSAGTVLVAGALAATTGAATLSAAGSVPYVGTLSATTGAATLSSAGTVLVTGTLSTLLASTSLSAAGKVLVSALLSATLGAASLSSAGTVAGAVTLPPTIFVVPTVPPSVLTTIQPPASYTPSPLPIMGGDTGPYTQRELGRIANAIASAVLLLPQGAIAEPATKVDAMQRLARSPWRPIGGSVDAWVYWDAPSQTWLAL